ncbi:hypothetical protein ACJJTC_010543 [Scirpophaga incertulas]
MSQKCCCVPGCVESGESHPVLHLFPNPDRYPDRFRSWVLAVGGDIILFSNKYIHANRRVRHRHFEEKDCCRYNKLSQLAIPKKYLPEDNFVFCHEVEKLMEKMGLPKYSPNDWRLFIDSSKRSLKCVLLHNGNKYGSIPIDHSTQMKEEYDTIALVLKKIKYYEHQWVICVDLKMVNFLLGQQSGYTKYPCFLCFWDSRDKKTHWVQKEWPKRENVVVGQKNVINVALVEQ